MSRSAIEWTEETWNPVTGCDKTSPGCDNCYAERLAYRLQAMGNPRYRNGFEVTLHRDLLDEPFRWRRPRRVFVCSMSDLFHPKVDDLFIDDVFWTMAQNPEHTFQVLTKRAGRAARLRSGPLLLGIRLLAWKSWPAHIWMGTTIESDLYTFRADQLREIDAPVRFLSCEPLLGPLPSLDLKGIGWLIVGGESGPGHRPMKAEWVRDLRDRCLAAGVSFFFKQWGGARPGGSRLLDGVLWNQYPGEEQSCLL